LAMVKLRSGPNWASIGLAQEALVGVRHSSTLFREHQARMALDGVGRQVAADDVDGCAVRAGGPDRPERGQGVVAALAAAHHAPHLVVAEAVAAVEVADTVGVGGRQPIRPGLRRPAGGLAIIDRQMHCSCDPGELAAGDIHDLDCRAQLHD
jgi:hypothetical protein